MAGLRSDTDPPRLTSAGLNGEYGYADTNPSDYEEDHLIPLDRMRQTKLSFTHNFPSDEEAELYVGEACEAAP